MKVLFLTVLFVFSLSSLADCKIDFEKMVMKTEQPVPAWNPKTKRTELQNAKLERITSPFPDVVQLYIPISGNCKRINVRGIAIYRQVGPQSWGTSKDHSTHQKPESLLEWEEKPKQVSKPQTNQSDKFVVLRNVPVGELLVKVKESQRVWSLNYKVSLDHSGDDLSGNFKIETPLIH